MECKVIIQDIKISGRVKNIIAKCVKDGKTTKLKFQVPKDATESEIKIEITKMVKITKPKSIIGKTYNIKI